MKYHFYDQHVHNHYSHDSFDSAESYIQKAKELGLDAVYFTNHLDLDISQSKHDNYDVNFEKEKREYEKMSKKYPEIQIRRGIEIGYNPEKLSELQEIVEENNFSVINGSLHFWGYVDFYHYSFFEGKVDEILDMYFDGLIEMANSDFDYDIFSHLDYGFKTPYKVNRTLKIQKYEDKIIKVFKGIIAHNKVLEINTKVETTIDDENHLRYLLKLYKSLGGELICVGSDAHDISRLCDQFDKYIDIIKSEGFTKLTYIVDRKQYFYSLID